MHNVTILACLTEFYSRHLRMAQMSSDFLGVNDLGFCMVSDVVTGISLPLKKLGNRSNQASHGIQGKCRLQSF